MLEFPEVQTLATQLAAGIKGKQVAAVFPPSKAHKFCWYEGDPADYDDKIRGSAVQSAEGFGIFAAIRFDNGYELCFNDGVNVRLLAETQIPKDYQLVILLEGGAALVFTVTMYGGILLHDGACGNEYYQKSRAALSPLSEKFPVYFLKTLTQSKENLSVKAFLATEQRFPGIGNGVLQDILFAARLHPKRKLSTLDEGEKERLALCVVDVLREMTDRGGRDTEKDLYGMPGGYITKMSKYGLPCGCPACGGPIVKEAYLGGSVYYCPRCQSLGDPDKEKK